MSSAGNGPADTQMSFHESDLDYYLSEVGAWADETTQEYDNENDVTDGTDDESDASNSEHGQEEVDEYEETNGYVDDPDLEDIDLGDINTTYFSLLPPFPTWEDAIRVPRLVLPSDNSQACQVSDTSSTGEYADTPEHSTEGRL